MDTQAPLPPTEETPSPSASRSGALADGAQTTQEDSGGADPTRPIGPGNPPRAHQFQPGNPGRPPGIRDSRQLAQKLLSVMRKVPQAHRAQFAEVMGEHKEEYSQRELMLAAQMLKAITKGDTAAFRAVLEVAGELRSEEDNLPPPTALPPVTFVVQGVWPEGKGPDAAAPGVPPVGKGD